ncbi:MAG: 50S ribosomal protein L13 [Polyangiaceae bacterium]|nr:50S ribosomal protein L13 [Polyangiaceae bacterium]
MRTYNAKPAEAQEARTWWIVDAEGQPLGRLASKVATILRGKHKPTFTPHVDTGDFVVVINAAKVKATGAKMTDKIYHTHSGYVGSIKSIALGDLIAKDSSRPIKHAVKGMLPKSILGRQLLKKLKVYEGSDHPHAAQNPQPLGL